MSVEPISQEPGEIGVRLVSTESQRATYAIAIAPSAVAATPTDIFLLKGSATRTVVIKRAFINSSGNTNGLMAIRLIKRTADNTGGTRTDLTTSICKYDSNSPAPTAVPYQYTVNPTSRGAGTNAFTDNLQFGTSGQPLTAENEFARANDMPVKLRGTSEFFAINLNGGTVPTSGLVGWTVVWEEY